MEKIIFTGGGSNIKGLSGLTKDVLNVESEVGNPFKSIKTPDPLKDKLKNIGPEFSVAIGVALRGIEELS